MCGRVPWWSWKKVNLISYRVGERMPAESPSRVQGAVAPASLVRNHRALTGQPQLTVDQDPATTPCTCVLNVTARDHL